MARNNQKARELAEKYQLKGLNSLNEHQLRQKCTDIFKELVKMEIKGDILARKLKIVEGTANTAEQFNKYSGYNINWEGIEKVIFILKLNNRPMALKEIAAELLKIEPRLKQMWKDSLASVGSYIYRGVKSERITRGKRLGGSGYSYSAI